MVKRNQKGTRGKKPTPASRLTKTKVVAPKSGKKRAGGKKANGTDVEIKKRTRRYRPGTRALMNVRKNQKTQKSFLKYAPMSRYMSQIVSEITSERGCHAMAITKPARKMLHSWISGYGNTVVVESVHCTELRGRQIVTSSDVMNGFRNLNRNGFPFQISGCMKKVKEL